jgi:hypothetical protein
MAAFFTAEKFLAKHLGGRYQESATPEVTARLGEITVDPKSVEAPKQIAVASVSLPKPAFDLTPRKSQYKMALKMGDQNIAMDSTSEIREENGNWVAHNTAKSPMGEMSDETVITKGTLVTLSRTVHQGPATIEVTYKDGKASGTMSMNGQPRPITADLGGPLFAEGAGSSEVLASLPLADSYSATFRNFDLMKQKLKLMQLNVRGSEKVTVPAGSFDTWKVELTLADGEAGGSTIWVDKATRKVVKQTSVMPQMNGATLTSELVE